MNVNRNKFSKEYSPNEDNKIGDALLRVLILQGDIDRIDSESTRIGQQYMDKKISSEDFEFEIDYAKTKIGVRKEQLNSELRTINGPMPRTRAFARKILKRQ